MYVTLGDVMTLWSTSQLNRALMSVSPPPLRGRTLNLRFVEHVAVAALTFDNIEPADLLHRASRVSSQDPTDRAEDASNNAPICMALASIAPYEIHVGRSVPQSCFGEMRERVIKTAQTGISQREAAERFEVSASSAVRWLQRWHDRSAAAKPRGGGFSPLEKVAAQILAMIAALRHHPFLAIARPDLRKDAIGELSMLRGLFRPIVGTGARWHRSDARPSAEARSAFAIAIA